VPKREQPVAHSSRDDTGRLPQVVVLGGGVAGMTAAMELSRPGWREKYDSITVYQYGWRLGGKGASGRGPHGRIEEHGLHIWLGFYENAFRMLRECYEELGRDPSSPIRSIDQAFERASLFIVQEPRGDSWLPWLAEFPESDEQPGRRTTPQPSLWEVIVRGLRLALAFNEDAKQTGADLTPAPGVSLRPPPASQTSPISLVPASRPVLRSLLSRSRQVYLKLWYLVSDIRQFELAAALALAEHLPLDVAEHDPADHSFLAGLVDRAVDRLRELRDRPDELSDQARREWYLTDVLLAAIRGVLADGVLHDPDGLDSIDHYDLAEWLIRHGASPESAYCGMVTTLMYDLPFAYQDGEPTKPAIGAGTALRGAIRTLFTYTGAIAWKMRAGMGDVVFAPMFEVLERRGVRFEFFHRVEALEPSRDGARVASIVLSRQATLRHPDAGYGPLHDVKGLPCWPNAPLNDQLVAPLSAEDAESFWSTRPPEGPPVVLHDGVEFDTVVLAIPVGAHPYICAEMLERNPRWRAMVANLGTIYTQAFQLWLSADMHQLGCDWPPATTGGYLEPFDTYADMRQLIERELWRDGEVGSIAYFCNVLPTPAGLPSREDRQLPERARRQVKANALAFLREGIAPLWPGGVHRYPTEFRWELLVDDQNRTGAARFDSQFWRANVDPSERYVQSLPATSQYRLAPHETGFENLVFAGDWTRCGLNSGCVEAAVVSGLLAAAAIEPAVAQSHIIGSRGKGAPHAF
jgi:uncharacterized protein with NAD-binding domain and iron-sulfur cluster